MERAGCARSLLLLLTPPRRWGRRLAFSSGSEAGEGAATKELDSTRRQMVPCDETLMYVVFIQPR